MLLANQIKISLFCSFSWHSLFHNYIFLIKWLQLIMKVLWCYYTVSSPFNYLAHDVWHVSSLFGYLGLSRYLACILHIVIDTCLCTDIQILSNKISFIYTQKLVVKLHIILLLTITSQPSHTVITILVLFLLK